MAISTSNQAGEVCNANATAVDAGLKFTYQDMVWLGATYRHDDAVSALVGYTHKNFLMFVYSYDVPMSNLEELSKGTHEVMIAEIQADKAKEKSDKADTPLPPPTE